jgi:T-complex protein 1 subunit gamma
LQAKHANEDNVTWGVDGIKGTITDMKDLGVWEPLSVKLQTYKTAIEVYCLLTLGAHAPEGLQ